VHGGKPHLLQLAIAGDFSVGLNLPLLVAFDKQVPIPSRVIASGGGMGTAGDGRFDPFRLVAQI